MAIKGVHIADLIPLPSIAQLPGGLFEVDVLAGPGPGAYVTRALSLEQLQAYLASGASGPVPGPNLRPDLLKQVRFYLAADRDASPDGGDCFEELDTTLCATGTVVLVQFYRTDQTQPVRNDVKLVATYDPTATTFVNRSGSFATGPGSLVPARFVPSDSAAAQYGYVRRDTNPASIDDWHEGELSIWSIGGSDQFATAKQTGGPFPAFTGDEDDYWKPAAKPQAQDLGPIVAQHTQQLATIAVQSSPVFGFLEAGGDPVGYTSIDEAISDPRPKTSQTFNTATLVLTKSNPANGTGWAYATAGLGRTLQFGNNVELTLAGNDAGSLTFQDFYLEAAPGARGGKVRLLTTAPDTTPPAQLPRLSAIYCGKPVEFVNGGAALLSGYYQSLLGTGTAFVVEPFHADNVAAGVRVVRLTGAGGSDADIHFQAQNVSGNAYSDLELFELYRLDGLDGRYNLASWEAQVLGPDGLALSAVVNTQANLNTALAQAFTAAPAFVVVRHRLLRAATTDAALARFTYVLA